MITGRQALNSIEEASAKVRADEMRLDSALRSASEEAARLRQERLRELRALAELKFGLIQKGDLIQELDEAEQQVKELLYRIRRETGEAEARRQEAADTLQKAESLARDRAQDYDTAANELHALEQEIAPSVTSDPAWTALKARFDKASQTASEADKKAAQAEVNREQKKNPYLSDPLFMYLWRHVSVATQVRHIGLFIWLFCSLFTQITRC
jgi:polyhydroxyalkanoate synthesis regulator phasin